MRPELRAALADINEISHGPALAVIAAAVLELTDAVDALVETVNPTRPLSPRERSREEAVRMAARSIDRPIAPPAPAAPAAPAPAPATSAPAAPAKERSKPARKRRR